MKITNIAFTILDAPKNSTLAYVKVTFDNQITLSEFAIRKNSTNGEIFVSFPTKADPRGGKAIKTMWVNNPALYKEIHDAILNDFKNKMGSYEDAPPF